MCTVTRTKRLLQKLVFLLKLLDSCSWIYLSATSTSFVVRKQKKVNAWNWKGREASKCGFERDGKILNAALPRGLRVQTPRFQQGVCFGTTHRTRSNRTANFPLIVIENRRGSFFCSSLIFRPFAVSFRRRRNHRAGARLLGKRRSRRRRKKRKRERRRVRDGDYLLLYYRCRRCRRRGEKWKKRDGPKAARVIGK